MRLAAVAIAGLLWVAHPPLAEAATAQAQTDACRAPILSLQDVPESFEPGASYSLLFGIENSNGPPVDAVRATVTTAAPAGWSAIPSQRELTLGPRNVSVDVLTVTAPSRGTGVPSGNVTLLVLFACTGGDVLTSSSASIVVEVEISSFSAPWPLVIGALVVLASGITVLGVRRLRRGVGLVATTSDRTVEPGKSVKFTFVVENRRGKPQKLRFVATGVPEAWTIHLALDDVDLEPGEEKALWAILRAPASAKPGSEADVTLRLEGGHASGEAAAARVRAKVVASP